VQQKLPHSSKGRKRAVTKEADHFGQCVENKAEYSDAQVQSGDKGESRTGNRNSFANPKNRSKSQGSRRRLIPLSNFQI
jgi:hypothetical protein